MTAKQPRRCFLEPINEVFHAADLLSCAVDAHEAGDKLEADRLIRAANMPELQRFLASIWGKVKGPKFERLPKDQLMLPRMPPRDMENAIIKRDGWNCVFCGMPVIHKKVRDAIKIAYPDALPWPKKDIGKHVAFMCLSMQFDHVVPHSRGGETTLENIVIACWPCNFPRWHWTLEEVGLIDPRTLASRRTTWDGLERFIKRPSVAR